MIYMSDHYLGGLGMDWDLSLDGGLPLEGDLSLDDDLSLDGGLSLDGDVSFIGKLSFAQVNTVIDGTSGVEDCDDPIVLEDPTARA